MSAHDEALAALCEATQDDVAEFIFESNGGWFGNCPVCGKPQSEHPAAAPPGEPTE
jgi:hypothetical protein